MDILYASVPYPPSLGGGQLHLHTLVKTVAGRGHGVRVVCQWSRSRSDWLRGATIHCDPPGRYSHEGVPVRRLGFRRATRLRMLPWVLAYRQKPLRGLAIERLSALVRPYLDAAAAGPCDLVHVVRGGCEFLARAAREHSRRLGLPLVVTALHHPDWTDPKYRHWHRIFRAADAVIALTESEKRLLVERQGVPEERVHVTGTGPVLAPSHSVEALRERYGLSRPYVLFVGRKDRYKGWSALLAAAPEVFRSFPELELVFVGEDSPKSEAAFATCGDGRVRNLGQVDLETKTAAIAGCELLCVPSSSESFGGVFTEAWSFEKPVIAGRIPPVAEVIDDGVDGLLSSQDPDELGGRIVRLLSHPEEARRMGRAGRGKVDRRYNWPRLATKTVEIYESLLPAAGTATAIR